MFMAETITLSFKAPKTLAKRIEDLASKLKRDKSFVIRKAIEDFLEEQSDYQIAVARLAESGSKKKSLEEIAKELNLKS